MNPVIHESGLRELLPKEVVDGQSMFMYSDYDAERAKADWADIVKRLKKVTDIRAAIDAKRGKGEDKRQKWGGVSVPELPDELVE